MTDTKQAAAGTVCEHCGRDIERKTEMSEPKHTHPFTHRFHTVEHSDCLECAEPFPEPNAAPAPEAQAPEVPEWYWGSRCVECGKQIPAGQMQHCLHGGYCNHHVPVALRAEIASLREKLERRDELLDQYAARQDELRNQLDQLRARVAILDAQKVKLPELDQDVKDKWTALSPNARVGEVQDLFNAHKACRERQLLDAQRAVQASYNKGWNDAIEAARLAYGAHYHKAHYENGVRTDACGVCGEDFRDPIHLRTGETVLNRIDALAGKLEGK